MKDKLRTQIKYGFGVAFIALGIILNYFEIGTTNFQIFGSVGNWAIYIGIITLIITTLRIIFKKKEKKVDERMEFIAAKALRMTFLFFMLGAFLIMILDGIKTITMPYHLFMSYMVCGLLVIYLITYKILLRRN